MKYEKILPKNKIIMHFSPSQNEKSIIENGILLPTTARQIKSHVSPYKVWLSSQKKAPNSEKDMYTYFGGVNNVTFKYWFSDISFLNNHVGFILKDGINSNSVIDWNDSRGFDRWRINESILYEELYTLKIVNNKDNIDKQTSDVVYLTIDKSWYKKIDC